MAGFGDGSAYRRAERKRQFCPRPDQALQPDPPFDERMASSDCFTLSLERPKLRRHLPVRWRAPLRSLPTTSRRCSARAQTAAASESRHLLLGQQTCLRVQRFLKLSRSRRLPKIGARGASRKQRQTLPANVATPHGVKLKPLRRFAAISDAPRTAVRKLVALVVRLGE